MPPLPILPLNQGSKGPINLLWLYGGREHTVLRALKAQEVLSPPAFPEHSYNMFAGRRKNSAELHLQGPPCMLQGVIYTGILRLAPTNKHL